MHFIFVYICILKHTDMNIERILKNYNGLTLSFPELYSNEFHFSDYFRQMADDGGYDVYDEVKAWIDKFKDEKPDADDLTVIAMAFVGFFKQMDGEELKDNEHTIVKFNGSVIYDGGLKCMFEKV